MSAPANSQRLHTRAKSPLKPPIEAQNYRHLKSDASTHAAAGVVQTFPNNPDTCPRITLSESDVKP